MDYLYNIDKDHIQLLHYPYQKQVLKCDTNVRIVKNIFNNKSDKIVRVPVAFAFIIQNIIGQQGINSNSLVDITMLEAFQLIEETFEKLEKIVFAPPTELFKVLFYYSIFSMIFYIFIFHTTF